MHARGLHNQITMETVHFLRTKNVTDGCKDNKICAMTCQIMENKDKDTEVTSKKEKTPDMYLKIEEYYLHEK